MLRATTIEQQGNKLEKIPYFPTDNAHLTYNAHPKLFYIPFEEQITRT